MKMKTIKMKKLLEGFAWEREPGKPLPTLADVTKKHAMNEQDPAAMAATLGMKDHGEMQKRGEFDDENGKENIIVSVQKKHSSSQDYEKNMKI